MPDEWGGVEIEDEFGGVLVEDEPAPEERPLERESADFAEPEIPRPSVGATGYWGAGATGTWEDESGIPPEIGTEQTRRIRAGVDLLAARLQGDKEQREAESLGEQYRSIERFTPTGILNQPERIARAIAAPDAPEVPERFQPGQPIFPIPEPTGTNAMAGLGQLGVQTLNALQTPEMIVTAPAAANPVGRALFAGDMGRHIPEQVEQGAQVLGDIESTPAQKVVAGGTPVIAGTMTALLGKSEAPRPTIPERPAIPPQFIETMRRVDAAVPDALPRAKEAAIKKVADNAATIEVEAKVEPAPVGERPGGTPPREAPPAPADTLAADVTRERAIAAEKKALLDSEDIMTLGENPKWMELSKEFEDIKNRYQGRKPSDVVSEQPKAQTLEKGGNKITPETQPERIVVQAEQDLGGGETMPGYVTIQSKGNAQSGPVEAWRAAGHEIPDTAGLPSGTYTVAELKARANEKALPATLKAATPTTPNQTPIPARQAPVVEPGVGAVPENVSGAGSPTTQARAVKPPAQMTAGEINKALDKLSARSSKLTDDFIAAGRGAERPTDYAKKTDPLSVEMNQVSDQYSQLKAEIEARYGPGAPSRLPSGRSFGPREKAAAFFERESEAVGLGRSSLPPTVADVRAQRTADARGAEAKVHVEELPDGFRLSGLSVPEGARGKGIGTAAVRALIEKAEAAGKPIITTAVADSKALQPRLNAFYERLGFKHFKNDPLSGKPMYRYDPPVLESTPLDPASGAPVAAKVPDTASESVKMRKSAERATTAPEIPKPVQERIKVAPESRYTQQSMARVEDAVKAMPDAELAAIPADSNLYVASKLEQADRRFRAGDNDAGYAIFVELEKQGTSFGQNINQFKRLAATKPEFVATVIDKKLTKAGKDSLTPAQRTQAIETTRKAKAADLALNKATDAWTKKPTAENAAKAEAALDKANAEAVELQKFVAKFEPRSTSGVLKSVLQGNLLTPISEVANLFGNMSFLPFRALDRAVGTGLDIIDSAVRGKPRELSVQPLAGTAEALKGVGRGLKQIPSILIEGTGNVIKGETRAGLHPIKAWINQFAKNPEMPTTGGKLTLKDRLNLAIEGTLGVPAEAMLRGLGAGDVPFKEGARARVTAEQLKLNDVPRDQWGFAQKFPELFLPKEALQQIHKDTMAAVFQRESKTLNLLTNWLKGKGEVLDFVAATVAPYKLTPWNIVGEILSYNPLVAMTRGVYDASKGNTRAAKLNAGKMVVGSMLTGTGIWLYKNGLLAPSLDERDEAQKARVLSGKVLPPNHINVSGLKRATAGGDPAFKAGDATVDVFRAGGLAGAMFYMTANIGRDMERGPSATDGDMWMNIIRQSTLEQARFGLNQSFLSGVDGLLTAIKEGNADNYLRQWANTVGSIPLPNTLNTISRSMRKYQVDTRADDFKDKIGNMVKTKLGFAGLDDYLPLKRDFWGKPMLETPEGRDAIFYHFFDISKNKQVTSDPVELELYRIWRKTGDTAVIPSLPQRDVTFARTGYALNPQQYERYAELVGENRRNIVDAMAVNPQFHKLDDEQKIKLLERVYRDGMERGKALFYREFNGQLTPKQGRAGFPP